MAALVEQISVDRLVTGRWYGGRGRNGNVGFWDGEVFLVIGYKLGEYRIKREPSYTAESGCFQPFLEVDEGRMIEPFGEVGWDAHYGSKMEFRQAKDSG